MRQIAGIRVLGRVMPEIARVGHCLFLGSAPPVFVRIPCEHRVVVARIARHLLADPLGLLEGSIHGWQLDLGHDEALVVAEEFVHLPDEARKRNLRAGFGDDGLFVRVRLYCCRSGCG